MDFMYDHLFMDVTSCALLRMRIQNQNKTSDNRCCSITGTQTIYEINLFSHGSCWCRGQTNKQYFVYFKHTRCQPHHAHQKVCLFDEYINFMINLFKMVFIPCTNSRGIAILEKKLKLIPHDYRGTARGTKILPVVHQCWSSVSNR